MTGRGYADGLFGADELGMTTHEPTRCPFCQTEVASVLADAEGWTTFDPCGHATPVIVAHVFEAVLRDR